MFYLLEKFIIVVVVILDQLHLRLSGSPPGTRRVEGVRVDLVAVSGGDSVSAPARRSGGSLVDPRSPSVAL